MMGEERLRVIEVYARTMSTIKQSVLADDMVPELIEEIRRLRKIVGVARGCPSPNDISWTDRDTREFLEDLHEALHG